MLHTTLMRDTTRMLAHTLTMRSLSTSLMNVVCKLVRIELLPSFDPRPVAPHSHSVIGTVLVATASPQSNIVTTSSDSNKLLPASDPWAVAANPVAFISTPPAVSASSEPVTVARFRGGLNEGRFLGIICLGVGCWGIDLKSQIWQSCRRRANFLELGNGDVFGACKRQEQHANNGNHECDRLHHHYSKNLTLLIE